jgi:hypothetical protein
MGFRNPVRALPANNVTSGEFTGDYTLPGTFTVGDPDAAHLTLDGAHPLRYYGADGVTVLIDLDATGSPTFTGKVATSSGGHRIALLPDIDLSSAGFGHTAALVMFTGNPSETSGGYIGAYDPGGGAAPQLYIAPPGDGTIESPYLTWTSGWAGVQGHAVIGAGHFLQIVGDATAQLRVDINALMRNGKTIDSDDTWHTFSTGLANSWVNYGAPYEEVRYRKIATGVVVLQGVAKNGTKTAGTRLFTLPAGYRPANQHTWLQPSSDGSTRIDVLASGQVQINPGAAMATNTYLSLDGIRFNAEA